MNRYLHAASAAALLFAAASGAGAQTIDYGSLQQLFNEPVTTSATGSPKRATEAPVDMTIITADEIKRSGATDLPTILSRVPGIDILNWSAGGADISVRGYDAPMSPRLLVLINGRQVYLDDYGYTNWASLPVSLNEIRQIEVVRGPNSALFGFNAVGGVVNIITFDPKFDTVNAVEAHGGTQNDAGGSIATTFHLGDRLSMRVSGGGERQHEWRNAAQDKSPWAAHGAFDLVGQLTAQTVLRVEGAWSRNADNDLLFNSSYALGVYTNTGLKGALTSVTQFGDIKAQAYVNNLTTDFPSQFVKLGNQIIASSVEDLLKIGAKSTVRIAVEYRNNSMGTIPVGGGYLDYSVWAPSAMWDYRATDKLALTAAVRLDALDLSRTGTFPANAPMASNNLWKRSLNSVSVNVGAVYKLTAEDAVRATYARGVQAPSLVDFGALQVTTPGLFIGGNPDLSPTVISNYELSYDRNLEALNAKVSVKGFYQQNQKLIAQGNFLSPAVAPTATTLAADIPVDGGDSDMAGFEVSASGKVAGGFHWSADTTYTNVVNKLHAGLNPMVQQIDYAATTPKFRGNVSAGWSDSAWSADLYVHYTTAFDTYNALNPFALQTTSGYASLAGRVAYDIGHGLVAAVSGQNLGADRQVQGQANGLQAERRVIVSLSKSW